MESSKNNLENGQTISLKSYQNIYINNDEEIKEGDYGILGKTILSYHQMHKKWGMPQGKKIILTTDQDLINDGVQPIPDEFLEWFVKNPSCESVEVKCYSKFNDGDFTDYKIIIPKEKGINSWSGEKGVKGVNGIECCDGIREPKQSAVEWLVEYFSKYVDMNKHIEEIEQAKEKENEQKGYSEEEVELIANEMVNWAIDNIGNPLPQSGKKFDEVIAKFKNK